MAISGGRPGHLPDRYHRRWRLQPVSRCQRWRSSRHRVATIKTEAPNRRMRRLLTIDRHRPRPTFFVTPLLYEGREPGKVGRHQRISGCGVVSAVRGNLP
jgi:hypothetical protein